MEDSFDLKQLWSVLRQNFVLIALSAFFAGAAGFVLAEYIVPKKYESSAMLYVENNQNTGETLNINDITAAQKLVNTCQIIFQSNSMLDSVIFELDLPYSKEELSGMITVTSVNSTEVMRITAESDSPSLSSDIVNVLVELAQDEFVRVIKSGSIEVVEYGEIAEEPSFPSPMLFTAAGLLIGAAASYIGFFLKEILSVTVTGKDDLAKIYNVPVFAEIIDFEAATDDKYSYGYKYGYKYGYGSRGREEADTGARRSRNRSDPKKRYILDENTPFIISEAYRAARTNLIFSLAANGGNIISFTSAVPGEGKSTTCANMSIAFAEMGKKALLIDCDMRKPTVHTAFKLNNTKGLSSVLGGFCKSEEAVVKNVRPSLDVLPSGPIPPNPTELLGSDSMVKLLKSFSAGYDYVLLDTPPINVVTDSQLLNSIIGGHVFIVRENSTTHPDISEALDKVNLAKGRKLGFVKVFCGGGLKSRGGKGYGKYGKKYGYYSSYEYRQRSAEDKDSE